MYSTKEEVIESDERNKLAKDKDKNREGGDLLAKGKPRLSLSLPRFPVMGFT